MPGRQLTTRALSVRCVPRSLPIFEPGDCVWAPRRRKVMKSSRFKDIWSMGKVIRGMDRFGNYLVEIAHSDRDKKGRALVVRAHHSELKPAT